ncbi:hypothetical protein N7520_007270 [Penicillium odoratum]|uniref:uncharacterized protein n=1 Tax=Penicillium odoratum TaxID=1167516 RepID=UPI002548A9CC|nr:uncharacterized protein N7520_007270 [Penicillium odoratum]KAJ5760114.1 hypothetical protein N7520_007270 [Penicillium odoratum]
MPRNAQFRAGREPHLENPSLKLHRSRVSGPLSFLNPTRAGYAAAPGKTTEPRPTTTPAPGFVEHLWRSRDSRKGRHAIQVDYQAAERDTANAPGPTSTIREAGKGIIRMATCAPYWDVSYLVAVTFTIGSAIWIINAFFVWLPLVDPQTEFAGESLVGGGVTGFIGATVFEIGSVLLLLEAVNANQTGCFAWALETELKKAEDDTVQTVTVKPAAEDCQHHHANKKNLVGAGRLTLTQRLSHDVVEGYSTASPDGKRFRWIPSLSELLDHYLHELGFLASLVQFFAASIFWIAGLTGLPGIIDHMSQGLTDGIYWVPQIVGGTGFILSGLLFTLETQQKWYKPAPRVLGWHIGVWNFIGGIGFTLCGALGPASASSGVEYQATLATFWGSWAFMIGSTIQWYESLQKYPVEKKPLAQTPKSS